MTKTRRGPQALKSHVVRVAATGIDETEVERVREGDIMINS